jgi:hypothetical protein
MNLICKCVMAKLCSKCKDEIQQASVERVGYVKHETVVDMVCLSLSNCHYEELMGVIRAPQHCTSSGLLVDTGLDFLVPGAALVNRQVSPRRNRHVRV